MKTGCIDRLVESAVQDHFNMNVVEAIYARRSIRQFLDRQISRTQVEELIGAAVQAPSAMNRQPWAFSVVQDQKLLRSIGEEAKNLLMSSVEWRKLSEHGRGPFSDRNFDVFYGAKTLIVICSLQDGFQPVGDCYLAAQNLMLAATAMGLGTCPIGFARDVLRSESFRKKLLMPATYTPVLPLAVGYPSGFAERSARNPPVIFSWLND